MATSAPRILCVVGLLIAGGVRAQSGGYNDAGVCTQAQCACGASAMCSCGTVCHVDSWCGWQESPTTCDLDGDCGPSCLGWTCQSHACVGADGGCTNDSQCDAGTICIIGGGYCVGAGGGDAGEPPLDGGSPGPDGGPGPGFLGCSCGATGSLLPGLLLFLVVLGAARRRARPSTHQLF
ncbi:MAG TPA: hypothetical protein VND93_31715 [Myxococcales bacterium]|nr:hypothetical protein [Myxococcales bacterium]